MPYDTSDEYLAEEKELSLTRNEALYLSDSITLLMEITPEQAKMQLPSRHLLTQGTVSVPID